MYLSLSSIMEHGANSSSRSVIDCKITSQGGNPEIVERLLL